MLHFLTLYLYPNISPPKLKEPEEDFCIIFVILKYVVQVLVIARKIIVITKISKDFFKSCFKASNLLKKPKRMFSKQLVPSV